MCAGESPDEPEGVAGEQVVVRSQGTPGLALGEQSVEECLDGPSAPSPATADGKTPRLVDDLALAPR